jgi:hypothetical protein
MKKSGEDKLVLWAQTFPFSAMDDSKITPTKCGRK